MRLRSKQLLTLGAAEKLSRLRQREPRLTAILATRGTGGTKRLAASAPRPEHLNRRVYFLLGQLGTVWTSPVSRIMTGIPSNDGGAARRAASVAFRT